ncbi:hypothetical protein AX16_008885 [Volvariella volvacea WC 439]|nr:hypothetical protein AX16_008885 [Volvariella volvacea WC 439]
MSTHNQPTGSSSSPRDIVPSTSPSPQATAASTPPSTTATAGVPPRLGVSPPTPFGLTAANNSPPSAARGYYQHIPGASASPIATKNRQQTVITAGRFGASPTTTTTPTTGTSPRAITNPTTTAITSAAAATSTNSTFLGTSPISSSSVLGNSRPFLTMMNSFTGGVGAGGRNYHGYVKANQVPLPEEDENRISEEEEEDGAEGAGSRGTVTGWSNRAATAQHNTQPQASGSRQHQPRVSWDSRRTKSDGVGQESSDDEVPQSFMIEATGRGSGSGRSRTKAGASGFVSSSAAAAVSTLKKGKAKMRSATATAGGLVGGSSGSPISGPSTGGIGDDGYSRSQPLFSVAGRKLPSTTTGLTAARVSAPPRPSELEPDIEMGNAPGPSAEKGGSGKGDTYSYGHGYSGGGSGHTSSDRARRGQSLMRGLDPHQRALWDWVNVTNLDAFLQEVYNYYAGKGYWSIVLSRGLNLLTIGFVIGFSTFLFGCIDYPKIRHGQSTRLSDVVINKCILRFSGFTLLFFILFTAFYVWQLVEFWFGLRRLNVLYNFYTYLLKIPDTDIQTISWPEVVRRIGSIREQNSLTAISSAAARYANDTTTAKLDAHDIANRIMRQENYLIALFNKELLDLRVPLPPALKRILGGSDDDERGKGKMLTKALEWNLRYCLMVFLFDETGQVEKKFLKSRNRAQLIDQLKNRFIFMGFLNFAFAPFIVIYVLVYSFFRYFEQYHKDPSTIGGRRYTSFAQWKFREYNELQHFFKRRLDESYPLASMYIGQFPNEKMTIIMRFVAFVAGAFAAVLFLATVLDPDVILHFEITPHRTVVFYLGVFGAILTVARGMIPEEGRVFDPEELMMEVIAYTHYMPDEWKGQLHSKKVHEGFGELFAMKIMIFIQEVFSVVMTPFVLWFSLPPCAPAIIDFFREFTVHVDGRGYVCSFAEFNFQRHGNVKIGAPSPDQDNKALSTDNKMEKSIVTFKAANPDWNPSDPSGSLWLRRVTQLSNTGNPHALPYGRRRFLTSTNSSNHLDAHTHGSSSPHAHFSNAPTTSVEGGASGVGTSRGMEASVSLADRALEYDRALLQSQHAASRRRGGGGLGASVMSGAGGLGASHVFGSASQHAGGGVSSSVVAGMAMAKTVLLEDSQAPPAPQQAIGQQLAQDQGQGTSKGAGSSVEGNGVVSGLGGSYVDGTDDPGEGAEVDEGLDDGGVIGLLAQIYGRGRVLR